MKDDRDFNSKRDALKRMYKAMQSHDEYAYVNYQNAKEDFDRISEADSWQGGS